MVDHLEVEDWTWWIIWISRIGSDCCFNVADHLEVEDWTWWIIWISRIGSDCCFTVADHLEVEDWIGLLFYRRGSPRSRGLDRIVVLTIDSIRRGSSGSRGLDRIVVLTSWIICSLVGRDL